MLNANNFWHLSIYEHDNFPAELSMKVFRNSEPGLKVTKLFPRKCRERSGLVVECLTRDQGATGSSLIGVTALCP